MEWKNHRIFINVAVNPKKSQTIVERSWVMANMDSISPSPSGQPEKEYQAHKAEKVGLQLTHKNTANTRINNWDVFVNKLRWATAQDMFAVNSEFGEEQSSSGFGEKGEGEKGQDDKQCNEEHKS